MRARMQRLALAAGFCLVAVTLGARAANKQAFGLIERGKYLAIVGDCAACHTARADQPYAGGKVVPTPFGNLLAPNITPDTETGIGAWSDEDFYRAMHAGIARNGMHLYAAFPYTSYTKVTRADVLAIRAWLATLQPVHNKVQVNTLPFPFNIRASLIGWDALFFQKGTFARDPTKTDEWNQGAYLVQGLGHCSDCHTPRNWLGGSQYDQYVQGGAVQGWFAPNLTASGWNGLGGWSVDDIVSYLKTGVNTHQLSSGPMAEVIRDSTSHMTETDLHAIAVYLKSLPAPQGAQKPKPLTAEDARMQRGAAIYADECSACHAPNGAGVAHLFPRLAGSSTIQQRGADSLTRVVLAGAAAIATPAAPTGPAMPSFAWKLSDQQVADVLTYIRNTWGNAAPAVAAGDVGHQRQQIHDGR